MPKPIEHCPFCGSSEEIRPKLVLIDEAWRSEPGKDARESYFADLRVDDLVPEDVRSPPLEQFVDGFYCERCERAFVPDRVVRDGHRRYQ
jgi:hypothetical protein